MDRNSPLVIVILLTYNSVFGQGQRFIPVRVTHIEQGFLGAKASPSLQLKAFRNSGMLLTVPLTRKRASGWGLDCACSRSISGRDCCAQA